MPQEPRPSQSHDGFQRPRLLEQMSGAGNHFQPALATDFEPGRLLEEQDLRIVIADNQQCGNGDLVQCVARKVGSSAATDDGADIAVRRCSTGAGTEKTERQTVFDGTAASFGVRQRSLLVGMDHWLAGNSVRNRSREYHSGAPL
jgi:hypothetical protein